ncbi:PstS family phosphate ABC transporter substrate-binding protein [Bhargavaea cecembensis]|uniref:PstS family phosphate ABC transporter substrate-binding protein n=1 Tax=Bhargavaea cecembensis TaxID=394098 RepID=UPI0005915C09|nr:PstS family phosphate ABC transporter substrate-binding protein [Bhargavaea cecembensis]
MKVAGKVLSLVGITVFILIFSITPILYIVFGGLIHWAPAFLGLLIGFITIIGMAIFNVRSRKVFYGVPAGILLAGIVASVPLWYMQSKPVVSAQEVDLFDYAPFSGTKTVSLDQPASFKITEDLPVIDGATALYPVYASFAEAVYPEREYDPYESEVMSNRTGEAYRRLIAGEADLIFALGPSEAQRRRAEEAGKELVLTPVGKEAFVFFVNEDNPVDGLTQDQLRGIYSGELTNWKEAGGKRTKIRAYQRPPDSGSQTALEDFMGDTPIMAAPTENTADLMSGMIEDVADYRNFGGAIGYTFRYYSESMIGNNEIKLLAVDGVRPAVDTIRSGDYPLTRELYAITAGTANPNVEPFIDWVLSEEGQEIVEKTGYVGIGK